MLQFAAMLFLLGFALTLGGASVGVWLLLAGVLALLCSRLWWVAFLGLWLDLG